MQDGGGKIQDGRNICIHIADSFHCTVEINTILLGASVRNPARDKVMRQEADIRKACSDFRDPSGNS